MKIIFLLVLFFIAGHLEATSLQDVTAMNMELKRMPYQRDALFPETTQWDYEVSLNFKWQRDRLFFESDLTGQTAGSRFRNIWWDYTLGLSVIPEIDLVWDHRSQHAMDWEVKKYPVRDSYGIRINLIK